LDAETAEIQVSSIRHEQILRRDYKSLAQDNPGFKSRNRSEIPIIRWNEWS
jgi:hypothetical protein